MCDHFTFEGMKKKSGAAAGLCEWVINIILYYDVVAQVEEKKQALRDETSTLEQATTRLSEVKALVADLEAKLTELVAEFDKAMKKNAVMAEAQKCQSELDIAQRLIGPLGAYGVIWEQAVQQVSRIYCLCPEKCWPRVVLRANWASSHGNTAKHLSLPSSSFRGNAMWP